MEIKAKEVVIKSEKDLPEAPISQGFSLVKKTGTWRNVRPVMATRSAPCQNACPLRVEIPAFIDLLTKAQPEKAAFEILKQNPFPSITGRLCPAKCEIGCNRNKYDEKVSIKELERFLGDLVLEKKELKVQKKQDKKVAILGASTAGMAAAYRLLLDGIDVTVFSQTGVSFEDIKGKIESKIVDTEEKLLKDAGLKIVKDTNKDIDTLSKEFDGVFVATDIYPDLVKIKDPKIGSTDYKNVFAGGDTKDISKNIKTGLTGANSIISILKGEEPQPELRLPRVVSYKEIVVNYFNHIPAIKEIRSVEEAIKEGDRCFSCGYCNSCGNCYIFCPDAAINWVNDQPEFIYDYCKGCGICVTECPRSALEMIPEK